MKSIKRHTKYITILLCVVTSALLTHFLSYENSEIFNSSTIINILITLFSVLLAIVALMITILDKYKNNVHNQSIWAQQSTAVLKSLSENTIMLLVLIFIVTVSSIFETLLVLITKFDVETFLLVLSMMLALLVTLDTTLSVHLLVIHLKDALSTENDNIELNENEIHLVEAYRFFTPEYKKEIESYIKTLAVRQQMDNSGQN